MEQLKQEKQNLHYLATQYIIKKNDFKKDIEALKSEIKDLNEKNVNLEGENTHQYNSYEERIRDRLQNAMESNYLWDT